MSMLMFLVNCAKLLLCGLGVQDTRRARTRASLHYTGSGWALKEHLEVGNASDTTNPRSFLSSGRHSRPGSKVFPPCDLCPHFFSWPIRLISWCWLAELSALMSTSSLETVVVNRCVDRLLVNRCLVMPSVAAWSSFQ